MKKFPTIMAVSLAATLAACSSSPNQAGSGGTPGTGGASASGAGGIASSQGGSSGGATGTGGRTVSRSGGAGAGGQSGTGGAGVGGALTGSGGTGPAASGGSGGSGGAAGNSSQPGTGGSSALGGTTSQPGTGGATATGGNLGRDGGSATGGAGGGTTSDAGPGGAVPSAGCSKTPTLKNSPSTTTFTQNTITVGGKSRQYILRWPDNYDNNHPYRLILGLHGATGKGSDVAGNPAYFGLFALANSSTIFIAPSADGGLWSAATDTAFVDEILKAVEADLCIDTSRVMLEGFSQGAAMSWTLACSRPNVFRAVVGHSGGGVANPSTCQPVAYFGSGGLQENVTQTTQSDQFAKWDGCTIETFAKPATGGHACYDYKGCSAGHPVRWCPYDGPHTPSPNDSGKSTSWMPSEVWPFFSQF